MSLLLHSIGFISIINIFMNNVILIRDALGQALRDDEAKIYIINRMIMQSVLEKNDFETALETLSERIMAAFGIPYSKNDNKIAKFLTQESFFKNNTDLKIEILQSLNFDVNSLLDSNENRGLMYALIENLPYRIIVPSNYNKGIFEKITKNEKYNIENYSVDFLIDRASFNPIYMYVLENKLINNLPSRIEIEFLNINGTNITINGNSIKDNKYVFIEQQSSPKVDPKQIIYVNTDKYDDEIGKAIPIKQFKGYKYISGYSLLPNTTIYSSIEYDIINIAHDNCIVQLLKGDKRVNFTFKTNDNGSLSPLIGNKIVFGNKTQSLIVDNFNNQNIESNLIIDLSIAKLEDILVKKVPPTQNAIFNATKIELLFNGKLVSFIGYADIIIEGKLYKHQDIMKLIDNFEEAFLSNTGASLIFDKKFIDVYEKATNKKYRALNAKDLVNTPDNIITEHHAEYIKTQIQAYKANGSSALKVNSRMFSINAIIETAEDEPVYNALPEDDEQELIDYVDSKVKKVSISNVLPADANAKILTILDSIVNPYTKAIVNEKINNFLASNYSGNTQVSDDENGRFSNPYYKYETKNYQWAAISKDKFEWRWDGKYYLNRAIDGAQVEAYYNSEFTGEPVNYYYPDSITYKNGNGASGTNGSDFLIGISVRGQTDDYGFAGTDIINPAGSKPNGNDILIGENSAIEYSGNNFLFVKGDPYGNYSRLYGGSGNDLLIGSGEIFTNHNYKTNKDSTDNENTVIALGSSNIYSSNAKNTILANSDAQETLSYSIKMFATGNDIFIADDGFDVIFVGGNDALALAKYIPVPTKLIKSDH